MDSRMGSCYHHCDPMMICMLNGCPCDDGYEDKPCDCFLDETERPSKDHVFDLTTGQWKLKDENTKGDSENDD